jgi:pyrroloquinoline quinone (PQQ) biosynthesis protein C
MDGGRAIFQYYGQSVGLALGVCLYREAYDFFQRREAQEQKHREHLERVREWERKREDGVVWGRVE